jgi:hypothetical protein
MDYDSATWSGLHLTDVSGLSATFAPDAPTLDSDNGDKTKIEFSIDDKASTPSSTACGNTVNDTPKIERSRWLGAWEARCYLSIDSNNGEANTGIVYETSADEETAISKPYTPAPSLIYAHSEYSDRIYDSNSFSGYANASWQLGTRPSVSGTRSEGVLKVAVGVALTGSMTSQCVDNGLWQGNKIGVKVGLSGGGVSMSVGYTIVDDVEGYAGCGLAFQGQELGEATLLFKLENWSGLDSGNSTKSVGVNGGEPGTPWIRTGELDTIYLGASTTAQTNLQGWVKTEAKGVLDTSAANLSATGDAYYCFGVPTFETTEYRDADAGW